MASPLCAPSWKEKNSRVLEVLLSSATSTELMIGKIFGVGAVGLSNYRLGGNGRRVCHGPLLAMQPTSAS